MQIGSILTSMLLLLCFYTFFSGFHSRRRTNFFKCKIILVSFFKRIKISKCSLKCFFYAQNLTLCGRATLCISFIFFISFCYFFILLLLLSSSIFGTVSLEVENYNLVVNFIKFSSFYTRNKFANWNCKQFAYIHLRYRFCLNSIRS